MGHAILFRSQALCFVSGHDFSRAASGQNAQGFRVCVRTPEFEKTEGRTADPSTTLPRISCGTWQRWCSSCALLYGRAHTRPCPVQRGRKSGYASVGMTKGRAALPFKFDTAEDGQQVPPLRYASVGMTHLLGTDQRTSGRPMVPPVRDDKGEGGASIQIPYCGG
jgi:hypothetical protein